MRIAIIGAGVVTPIGVGIDAFAKALRLGRQKLSALNGVPIPRGKAAVGVVEGPDFEAPDRAYRMAAAAISQAVDGLGPALETGNLALIVSTLAADSRYVEDLYTTHRGAPELCVSFRPNLHLFSNGSLLNALGERFEIGGPRFIISNACASGNIALGIALDMIRLGRCRSAVICGVELVKLSMIWGAERAGFIGRALRPFHRRRDGSVLGEGAGALLVCHPDDVHSGAVIGWIEGFGCGVDLGAAAITLLEDGSGLRRCMADALADAGRTLADVEYINAHAPGTPLIDRLECKAICGLFNGHVANISINSTKSLTSHLSAASGIVEIVAILLQMRDGFLHGHAELDDPDPDLAAPVLGASGVERRVSRALSNACGGGGLNTSVVVTAPGEPSPATCRPAPAAYEEIVITGTGVVCPLGFGSAEIFVSSAEEQRPHPGRLEWFDIEQWYSKETNFRYMNRSGQLGAAAGFLAIKDASLNGAYAPDRIAVLSGTLLGGAPEASEVMCQAIVEDPDAIRPSMALDHGVHLSAALVRRYFGYNGITCTLTGSSIAGLQAVLIARDLLIARRADVAIVIGHDAFDKPLEKAVPFLLGCIPRRVSEGAAAIVLERADEARGRSVGIRALLGDAAMVSGDLRDARCRQHLACRLGEALHRAFWDLTYIAGPVGPELNALARSLATRCGYPTALRRMSRRTNNCMSADPLLALIAALADGRESLILACEYPSSVAALSLIPSFSPRCSS